MNIGPTWPYQKEDVTSNAQDVLRNLVLKTYSDPNVFVRELAQNAAGKGATALHIAVTVAQNDPTRVVWLTLTDDGEGMDRADIRSYLSCLGPSDNPKGQFGVGFFSTLATSDYVEVCSKKANSQPVRAAYWRDYDDLGQAIIEHGVGEADSGALAACGLAESSGTAIRIKFPYYGKLTQQQIQSEIPRAAGQWCKYLDLKIFLGEQQLESAVDLPCRATIKFSEQVVYKDPVANAERPLTISGALGVSDRTDVKFLKNRMVIQQGNLYHSGSHVTHIEGFINCDDFEIEPSRTSIINNQGQASGAIHAAVMERAAALVDCLFEQAVDLPDWVECEKEFVKERIWGYYKEKGNAGLPDNQKIAQGVTNLIGNPELMKRVVCLKSIAGPGDPGDPAIGKESTIFDVWQVLQRGKRIFSAARLDQIVEELARDGNIIMAQYPYQPLVQAMVNTMPGASIESAEGQEQPDRFKALAQTSTEQTAFLEICRMLDPAVILVEPIVADDPRTVWIQGYYRPVAGGKPEEIGINVANPLVAETIAQCSTDPIMAGVRIFHTIVHERNHMKFPAHNEEFLRGLEPLLDAKIGTWFEQLRRRYPTGK